VARIKLFRLTAGFGRL